MIVFLTIAAAAAAYPADVLNLKDTVMSLQYPNKGPNSGIEKVEQPELLSYTSEYFYTSEYDTSEVVFWAPENGGVTDNGSGPRTELTEPKNYFTFSGTHKMSFTTAVKETEPTGTICIGQIKGDSYDESFRILQPTMNESMPILGGSFLIVVELTYSSPSGEVVAHMRDENGKNVNIGMGNYGLNEPINMNFEVDGYTVTVSSSKVSKSYDYSFWKGAHYKMHFKVGVYDQGQGSNSSKGGKIKLSNLKISHHF